MLRVLLHVLRAQKEPHLLCDNINQCTTQTTIAVTHNLQHKALHLHPVCRAQLLDERLQLVALVVHPLQARERDKASA